MIDWDDLPEPDFDFDEPEEQLGAYINGKWVDVDDLPPGYGQKPGLVGRRRLRRNL